MSAWRKYMKQIAIGGGVLVGAVLMALAVTAGGCQSRPFAKKSVERREASVSESRHQARKKVKEKDLNRRELDELLSIK